MQKDCNADSASKSTALDNFLGIWEPTFSLLTTEELFKLPPPAWLIEGILEVPGLSVLFGPSGEGKTSVALDLSLRVSTGKPWNGHAVAQAPIVYITGEGGAGIQKRVRAWLTHHQLEVSSLASAFYLLEMPQISYEADVYTLLCRIDALAEIPRLIVIDTLSSAMVGIDENNVHGMSRAIEGCRKILQHLHTGTHVQLVHHTGKRDLDIERGSNALRGAVDTMILQRMSKDKIIRLSCAKQRDWSPFPALAFKLQEVSTDVNGEALTSCVVVDLGTAKASLKPPPLLNASQLHALKCLAELDESGASIESWLKALSANGNETSPNTLRHWRVALVKHKQIGRAHV